MSTPTEFDKELLRIRNEHIKWQLGEGSAGGLDVPEYLEAIKQAVDKYVIGDSVTGNGEVYMNAILKEQRHRLWGGKL